MTTIISKVNFTQNDVIEYIQHGCEWQHPPSHAVKNIKDISLALTSEGGQPAKGVFFYPSPIPSSLIFISTLYDGWDSLLYCIANFTSSSYTTIRIIDADEPLREFRHYSHTKNQRIIRSSKENSRWDFFQHGTPLSLEETDHYTSRKISNRLPATLLHSYAKKLDANYLLENFFTTDKPSLWINELWQDSTIP